MKINRYRLGVLIVAIALASAALITGIEELRGLGLGMAIWVLLASAMEKQPKQ